MRHLLIIIALVGCSDDNKTQDAPAAALDCPSYCTDIAVNCTGANAQYGGSSAADATAHCMNACAKFPVGTAADTGGQNTLGCRIYHSNNAKVTGMPGVHCVHAGPAGNQVDAAAGLCGDACTSFCTLEIGVCGLKGAAATGQYTNMGECMTACAGFEKTTKYLVDTTAFPSTNPTGNNLACRIYHATNASLSAQNATTHCPHTQAVVPSPMPCS